MAKLNQIVAIEKDRKGNAERAITKLYQSMSNPAPLSGISRTYTPKDDDGDKLPSESTLVQVKADDVLDQVAANFTALFDIVATKDTANTQAKADIVVDGVTLLSDVPVTTLLFLEKQLTDLRTMVTKFPTLDPAEQWSYDPAAGVWRTEPVGTTRTKKVPRNHVKAEATDKHPAQVELYYEDVIVGTWNTRKFSGALPADRVRQLLERITAVRDAVKMARETANSIEVTDVKIGDSLFRYLFAE